MIVNCYFAFYFNKNENVPLCGVSVNQKLIKFMLLIENSKNHFLFQIFLLFGFYNKKFVLFLIFFQDLKEAKSCWIQSNPLYLCFNKKI